MKKNPFHLGAMERAEWFYNRRLQVDDALRTLHDKGNVEVTGPRKIGKSWFLRYISHPTVLHQHNLDPRRQICVYIDCQHPSIQQRQVDVYQRMLECIIETAKRVGADYVPEIREDPVTGRGFEQALKEMHLREVRVIFLLDEFEVMAHNSNLGLIFFNHLRALAGADDVDVAFVTGSAISLVDLALGRKDLVGSPFFNIFQPIQLRLFSDQDSRHLVEDSLGRAKTGFPSDLLELVLELGGGYPFLLQLAGQNAWKLGVTDPALTEDEREAFLKRSNRDAARHFEYFWQKLKDQDQYVLAALPLLRQDQSYRDSIERLRDACLITERKGKYDYFSPLFEVFVRTRQVNGLLQAGPLVIDERRKRILRRGKLLDLSPTNLALLIRLMQQPGQVVSYEDLWQAVWSEEPYNLVEQVKSGIRSLRNALDGDADCIVNRRGEGYMFQIPPSRKFSP
jgi:hypothetical protein